MAKLLDLKLDTAGMEAAVRMLAQLSPEEIVRVTVDTVNTVAKRVHDSAIDKVVNDVNLSQQYTEERIQLRLADASQTKPVAKVVSPMRNVTLGRFDAGQHSKPVTWSNDRIQGLGKQFGKWPGWTKRTGDPSRGIAPDFKASGVDVTVRRGQTKDMQSAFMLPLRNGGGHMGVFVHDGGKLKHLYGPAVYQIYRNYINQREDQIQDDLNLTLLVNLDVKLKETQ